MRVRKAGKILLYCFAGLSGLLLLVTLALKLALDRAPGTRQFCAGVRDQAGRQRLIARDAHAERPARRQVGDPPRRGYDAKLESGIAAAGVARRQFGRAARRTGSLRRLQRPPAPRS